MTQASVQDVGPQGVRAPDSAVSHGPVATFSADPAGLADIYRDDVNLAVWKRPVPASIAHSLTTDSELWFGFQSSMTASPAGAESSLEQVLPQGAPPELSRDVAELVDMFCCLFELDRVGLRLAHLNTTMCPRFHVDHIPCRLLTTYAGPTTQWLPHEVIDRSQLGPGSAGRDDAESGLYPHESTIQALACGDVALLKGEAWQGNEGAGLVHRSPAVLRGQGRLLLTLDFSA